MPHIHEPDTADVPSHLFSKTEPQRLPISHVFSVDVEEYFQVEAFSDVVTPNSWNSWPLRVIDNTRRILEMLGRSDTKATFFFLGWIAKRLPSLVREVFSHGHEIACHSYWHRPVYRLTPEQFREDTRLACDVIQQAAGVKISGYRAPTWSIISSCTWALDILAEEGFTYSSSIFPIRHDLYGIPNASRFPYTHLCSNGMTLMEFPPATISLGRFNFPVAGGGYLRIFPLWCTLWALRRFEKEYQTPAVVYCHPWELDAHQPRVRATLKSRFRHYTNLEVMEQRLSTLLRTCRFQSFQQYIASDRKDGRWNGETASVAALSSVICNATG